MYRCAECTLHGCKIHDLTKTMKDCPSKNEDIQRKAMELYKDEENHKIAYNAALVEAEGYGRLTRMEEILLFMDKAGYKKIGLIFCLGLFNEAKVVDKILTHNGFEVISAICKNGDVPKSYMGVKDEDTVSGCAKETMCNPIGQALLMNEQKTDFNILLGLCVGHDSLVLKYLERPTTILAVKDRVTGHNPLAPIYTADGYYKKKLFK
ncbi:DUF1847 domain-containing protein [Lutispora thermophila]|uniref:Uncharacterized metal-binding protein n=1 Tax=Lutispora thermophila DSM 19022 TaxID=1122184 RepID=A0A1M6DVI8_9FIRM|nr:DUF1847 domain-containing protein [Lutispora thermophila]SHI77038.1 Uncharacterized metal-binding protein [Lutispora thermophila DSM 19022]